ncbi:hypothetical protein [Synechococcus sp. EJ6-Ellesmere]|uniref:hypothetical protein n=1 Tax=Synechococcus sp. EJ6-Ellesmere TaxID=2823734 RepID=UPI0020CD1971|nr:hypothetical protein [Synechococcus sp. EJ6-Ellesmere]MCP9825186.1 hypothetical protein [Synechococcus sp. EJ6-Ellesmere]
MQLQAKNLSQRLVLGGVAALLCATLPIQAQDRVPVEAVRAINMARTRAVKINGGLEAYRPASCMFATADPDNPCMVSNDSDGFIFRFLGGPPAWQERDLPPTLETEIKISPDGREVEELIYNGPPR